MSVVLNAVGPVTIEVRRESFVVHIDDVEGAEGECLEICLADLGSLIEALKNAQRYVTAAAVARTREGT